MRASSNMVIPAERAFDANVDRRSYILAGGRTPLAWIAGIQTRLRSDVAERAD
ncbi:MAG TPA: hypothetical protein VGF81_09810 [Solirubrobacteraceae bacterium]